ncbi:MAG: DNA internalization-related competence protein ComEC/Rec2 [Lachnospiraceae bacterium]|nr:DNA internalization-related competence protein ComEC/Rec2 [Lachnospiraceae bacterium]
MRRRPCALFCLFLIVLLAVLLLLGISPELSPAGDEELRVLLQTPRELTFTGKVRECSVRERSCILILDRVSLFCDGRNLPVSSLRVLTGKENRFPSGYLLQIKGYPENILPPENPGQFDAALYDRLHGIRFQMLYPSSVSVLRRTVNPVREAMSLLKTRLKERIRSCYPEDVSGLLCALLLGDKTELDDNTRSLWQTGGLMHMLTISGLHLTILGMGIYRFFRKMHLFAGPAGLLSSALMILYTCFTGAAVSTLRALLMFLMVIAAEQFGRSYDTITALSIAAVLLLLDHPEYLCYAGFQFSFGAVFSLLLLHKRSRLMQSIGLSLCVLPILLWHYYELPLFSVPVNLLFVPFLPVLLGFGILGTAAGPAVPLLTKPAVWLIRSAAFLLTEIRKLPVCSLIPGKPSVPQCILYYCLLALFLFAGNRLRLYKKRFLLLPCIPLLVLLLTFHPRNSLRLLFQSVGQGDSILAELPDGSSLLIDGGSSSISSVAQYRLLPCIKSEGISVLDYLFVTHLDADHVNGITELLQKIETRQTAVRVRALVLPYLRDRTDPALQALTVQAERCGIRILTVSKGDSLTIGDVRLEVLNPDPAKETVPADSNAQCIVLALRYREFDALLTGDVCGQGEAQLLASLEKKHRTFECLKVAHHGSRYSTPAELLSVIRPQVSIISCGRDNTYGHPHDTLLKRLADAGTAVLRTDRDGALTIETDGYLYRVTRFLDKTFFRMNCRS